ncbi:MAG TPA: hypothetical protein VMU17_07540 [Elusimicrobiota bacterium]|nr:hypothetical protein [Elusimicrobiota bacterium]
MALTFEELEADAIKDELAAERTVARTTARGFTRKRAERQKHLGEDEDWLEDVASETEIEDGVIWVYGIREHSVQAFTGFGIENLIETGLQLILSRWQ